jgi:hypothetical protein
MLRDAFAIACMLVFVFIPGTVCALKGRTWRAFSFGIGAVRAAYGLATPRSWWARRYYSAEQLALARDRYPDRDPVDEELLTAWEGVEVNPAGLDPITRKALRRAGLI